MGWWTRLLVPPTALVLAAWLGPPNSVSALLLAGLLYSLTGGRYRWYYVLYKTLPRDYKIVSRFIQLHWRMHGFGNRTVHQIFKRLVDTHPAKTAFFFEGKSWSFKQIDELSARVACYLYGRGVRRGDVIALVCGNRPEYIAMWLGLSRLGAVTALVNSNLRRQPLQHSLTEALQNKCIGVIVEAGELAQAVGEVLSELPSSTRLYQFGPGSSLLKGAVELEAALSATPAVVPAAAEEQKGRIGDKMLYIYTSGTTGLPKAAVITNQRFVFMTMGVNCMLQMGPPDVLYNSLPLYHTAGGMIGVGQVILCGLTMALRRKFSVSNFWKDCIEYRCTVAQYIGEICRYLLSGKETPEDRKHGVKLMFGNGLRPQIWEQFVTRFGIDSIGEFYGATEGNSNIVNLDNQVGAVGFVPRYAGPIYPVGLIRVNEDDGEPIRGADGLCIRCQPGESGVFVGKIKKSTAVNAFHGYADRKASEKKILRDVFERGDSAFNSGDILVMDELGYFYFKDRTGDTFRWKGENVATSEVEAVVSNVAGLSDAVVYGVEVPGAEGRAGMAALVRPNCDPQSLDQLAQGIKESLPAYARPVFLRVLDQLPMTGTFKLKKRDLQLEGYNPAVVPDPLFFLDSGTGKFVTLTAQLYQDIIDKKARL